MPAGTNKKRGIRDFMFIETSDFLNKQPVAGVGHGRGRGSLEHSRSSGATGMTALRKFTTCFLALALFALFPVLTFADDTDLTNEFRNCLARLERVAIESGLSPQMVKSALESVQRVEGVIKADRRQPESRYSFRQYLDSRVTEARVERGRELYQEHYSLLQDIYLRYGVSPEYIIALWGMETNFGSYFGSVPILDALATLACDGRRPAMFTREFVNALFIHEAGTLDLASEKGSWAGAMGHMQFMPSTYRSYAVDYDQDGRIDLFSSLPDAFASSANYLRRVGWAGDQRWGREVLIPSKFDYSLAGLGKRKSVTQWRALGLRDASGRPLPESGIKASLLMPMGDRGPAFLVYKNFRVIRKWNASLNFAFAVGHLADRIAGTGEPTAKLTEQDE